MTYDFSQFAGVGTRHSATVANSTYVAVEVPHTVVLSTETLSQVRIEEVPSLVTLGVNDVIFNSQVEQVGQAQSKVTFLRFNLKADVGTARWQKLRLERGGGSQDPDKLFGRNTNVGFVRVWRDINQNDKLDQPDIDIGRADTLLQTQVLAAGTTFEMVVASTEGFPEGGSGRIYVNEAELMTFNGYGTTLIGGTTYPTLLIVSRGDVLGDGPTPKVAHAPGSLVRKVDLFNQLDDQDLQIVVDLAQDQTISPTASVFFVSYDIGATAVKNDEVGVNILDRSWITVSVPNDASSTINVNVSKERSGGTSTSAFPYKGTRVFISPLTMKVAARNIAPTAAVGGQRNVPLEQFTLSVNSDFVRIAQITFKQRGTGLSGALNGHGDAGRLSLWLDDGNGAFTPSTDVKVADVLHSTFAGGSPFFANGSALADLSVGGIPYLTVTTAPVNVFLAVDVSTRDGAGQNTVGHKVGFMLETFEDMLGPNGSDLTAISDAFNDTQLPAASALVTISTAIIPLSNALPKIVIASNGYPAFAKLDVNGNVIISTATGRAEIDESKWILVPRTVKLQDVDTDKFEPLIDVNGDGQPDNFDMTGSGRLNQVSMGGTGRPSMDMNGDGLLDMDINMDGIPDIVTSDGQGNQIFFLVDEFGRAEPISDQGLALSAWNPDSTNVKIAWQVPSSTAGITGYQLAVGRSFSENHTFKDWVSFAGQTTSATLTGLALPVPKVTRLTAAVGINDATFAVADASKLLSTGKLIVGTEIVGVRKVDNTHFQFLVGQPGCPAGQSRGCDGSLPSSHLTSELVSDGVALVSVRGYTTPLGQTPGGWIPSEAGRPLVMYRVDTSAPGTPGMATPQVPAGQPSGPSFVVNWGASDDTESGVMAYEVQERTGTDPVWKSLGVIPAVKVGGVTNNSYQVGNASVNPWETPRKADQFLTYRVRSYNNAGIASAFTVESAAVATSITNSVVSNVSNYPNPFDSRKGGPEGRTVITYTLGANADVEIIIYDLLGYVVKTFKLAPGEQGARLGPNFVTWDGKNGMGRYVSKGGYIARIKVGSSLGTATVIRKIGVIH
ncbi:MAG: hypothetical protein FD126_547 [Elusimicrobia bacterium]|nr:MAG: hypothetical protein FD126_547 [Elusimicrobiota bacterium]